MANQNETKKPQITLSPSDIQDAPDASRRSALRSIGVAAAAVFGATMLSSSEAAACRRETGQTDSDPANGGDGVNHGRTGQSDSDSGDEPSCGRRRNRTRNETDQDPSDAAGRGTTNCTDSDQGRNADGPNHGRHCR